MDTRLIALHQDHWVVCMGLEYGFAHPCNDRWTDRERISMTVGLLRRTLFCGQTLLLASPWQRLHCLTEQYLIFIVYEYD